MTDLLVAASWLVAVAAVAMGATAYGASRDLRVAVPLLLDVLLAAGLLRLAATDTWSAIAVAAGVVLVRRLAGLGLAPPGPRPRRSAPPGPALPGARST